MHRFVKLLCLALLVQLFNLPAANFEQQEDTRIDICSESKAISTIYQEEEERENPQYRRKGRPPCLNAGEGMYFTSLDTSPFPAGLQPLIFINPVSPSYEGAKLEVLKSRSHPPTQYLLF